MTATEIRSILDVTDRLGIHRESVIIPLAREGAGTLRFIPPAKLEITAPETDFRNWLDDLPGSLANLDLARLKRSDPDEDS